eukprot:289149_1
MRKIGKGKEYWLEICKNQHNIENNQSQLQFSYNKSDETNGYLSTEYKSKNNNSHDHNKNTNDNDNVNDSHNRTLIPEYATNKQPEHLVVDTKTEDEESKVETKNEIVFSRKSLARLSRLELAKVCKSKGVPVYGNKKQQIHGLLKFAKERPEMSQKSKKKNTSNKTQKSKKKNTSNKPQKSKKKNTS